MALAIDSQEASSAAHRAVSSPLTWAFNNAAGNLLVVGAVVTNNNTAGSPTVSGVTYNAVSMSAGPSVSWDGGASYVQIFYLANPATGSHNVVVTGTNSGVTSYAILAGAISFSGAASTLGGTASGSSGVTVTHATTSAITAASGNYVVGVGGWGSDTAPTADSGQTTTFSLTGSNLTGGDDIESLYKLSAGSAITPGFTWSPADIFGMVAAEVQAAASAAAPFGLPRLPLMAPQGGIL